MGTETATWGDGWCGDAPDDGWGVHSGSPCEYCGAICPPDHPDYPGESA